MRRVLLIFALWILWESTLTPTLRPGEMGGYNTISGDIVCFDPGACMHEIGHKLDHEAGWISHTHEFGEAVRVYLILNMEAGGDWGLPERILSLPGVTEWCGWICDPQAETYAEIFRVSGGMVEWMPAEFHRFYDWDSAAELIKEYLF